VLNLIQVLAAGFLVRIVAKKDPNPPVALGIFNILALVHLHDFTPIAAFMLSYFMGEPACQSVFIDKFQSLSVALSKHARRSMGFRHYRFPASTETSLAAELPVGNCMTYSPHPTALRTLSDRLLNKHVTNAIAGSTRLPGMESISARSNFIIFFGIHLSNV